MALQINIHKFELSTLSGNLSSKFVFVLHQTNISGDFSHMKNSVVSSSQGNGASANVTKVLFGRYEIARASHVWVEGDGHVGLLLKIML